LKKAWQTYEDVARHLLDTFARGFGLGHVEGKQLVAGRDTTWEIDAKAVRLGDDGFLVVECRRYTTTRLSQEDPRRGVCRRIVAGIFARSAAALASASKKSSIAVGMFVGTSGGTPGGMFVGTSVARR